MSSDSDDDFGDLDLVSSAAARVQQNWTKSFDKTEIEKNVLKKPIRVGSEECVTPKKKSKRGKENVSNKPSYSVDDNSDEDEDGDDVIVAEAGSNKVEITPPASPVGGTPASASNKAVRGANRTKKTEKALQKLQTANFRKPKSQSVKSRNNSLNGDDSLLDTVDLEDNDSFDLKIRWKAGVIRQSVLPTDRMGKVMDKLSEEVGKQPGDIVLYMNQEPVKRDDTVEKLGLSIVSVLEARPKVDVHAKDDRIEIKLQSKDKRATVMVKIKLTDTMKVVMDEYSAKAGVGLDMLKFTFDGEDLDPGETAESLDLEGGECIDVHSK